MCLCVQARVREIHNYISHGKGAVSQTSTNLTCLKDCDISQDSVTSIITYYV